MDCIYAESLDQFIKKFKQGVINKLNSINLDEEDIHNQSDLFCMVLDFSPKLKENITLSNY
jgi:hypothetical protein